MSAPIRIKRRASGNPGAPAGLLNAELAFNEVDDTLYYGKGTTGGNGGATTVEAIAGKGAFVDKSTVQTISGKKTFSTLPESAAVPTEPNQLVNKKFVDNAVGNAGGGDMLKSVYDTDNDGKVDEAELADRALVADTVQYEDITDLPESFPPSAHTHAIADVTNLQSTLNTKAPLANPNFTGTPTAPTAADATNNTQIATTEFVNKRIEALVGAAPEALDTLKEIADALGDDPNFAGTVTTELAKKSEKAANLSDLLDVAEARDNLGLGSLSTQNSNNVTITGGTIDGVIIDGGEF